MSGLPRLSALTWTGFAAAAAMLIGAFGPWAKVVGLVNLSVSGTDGANDGWVVVVAALVGAAALFLHSRRERVLVLGTRLGDSVWACGALLAGAAGAAVTIYDRGNLNEAASENTSELAVFQVGWGLNLAMGASIVLGVVGFVALLHALDALPLGLRAYVEVASSPNASETQSALTAATVGDISQLAELHSRGVLTDEEFRQAKERVLPGLVPTTTPSAEGLAPEPSPTPSATSSRPIDGRWIYGGLVAGIAIVVAVILLIVASTLDDGSQPGSNPTCPSGKTLQENGYCG